jgi:hypothetical protein
MPVPHPVSLPSRLPIPPLPPKGAAPSDELDIELDRRGRADRRLRAALELGVYRLDRSLPTRRLTEQDSTEQDSGQDPGAAFVVEWQLR